MNRSRLLGQIDDGFDLEELRTICFVLGVDFDNLGGEGKVGKARELIQHEERKGQLGTLLAELARRRPNIDWQRPSPARTANLSTSPTLQTKQRLIKPARTRPAQGGDSISHYRAGAATLGCLVVDREDKETVHLLGDLSGMCPPDGRRRVGDLILQPGKADKGNLSRDQIATLSRWTILKDDPRAAEQNMSAAIAQISELKAVDPQIRGRGFLRGVRPALVNTNVYGVGRTSGEVKGIVQSTNATIELAWPSQQVAHLSDIGEDATTIPILFSDLIACSAMMARGDVGMILMDADNYALGLGFAASSEQSYFIPLQKVLDALNVDLLTKAVWANLTGAIPERRGASDNSAILETRERTNKEPYPNSETADLAQFSNQIQDIKHQLKCGRLLLFIGADFPEHLTGIPARKDLANRLAQRENISGHHSLAMMAQEMIDSGNHWLFTDFLRQATDTVGKVSQPIHHTIVKLVEKYQIQLIVSTAYDDLLQFAFRHSLRGLNVILHGKDLSFRKKDQPTMIQLFGWAQQVNTLVVSQHDQSALLHGQTKPELIDEIQSAWQRNSILFLGHDLTDPIASAYIGEWMTINSPQSYAVWSDLSPGEVDFLKSNRPVEVLNVDPLKLCQTLLDF